MNYRHGFHAGNFADVLKHVALVELVGLLTAKDKKLFVLDSHAGAGGYDLGDAPATRTGEAAAGVLRLMSAQRAGMPGAVGRYLAAVSAYDRKFGRSDRLRHYPGSPRLVRAGLRSGDRLVACELQPREFGLLKREFAGDRAVEVREEDGYHALKALLPPPERRGLILIDPPFERTDESERLLRAIGHGLRRFATGCYAVWYPIKEEAAAAGLADALRARRSLRLELRLPVRAPGKLAACGLMVINPPWKFAESMAEALPWIASALGAQADVEALQSA
ncbi:MAG: 23S rRNA (adenine(2030)-N(6))-methyltransferase RlmJ [Enhydrobacter sp.]|nr:MAG: 23S rRNA (adenine(2030)-N(6))-methyltransferase RlmJ [Enhydrobacter sp.]